MTQPANEESAACYSDVNHMSRSSVAFSLGLRSASSSRREMTSSVSEAFFPHGVDFDNSKKGHKKNIQPALDADNGSGEDDESYDSFHISADSTEGRALLAAYDGCPMEGGYEQCNIREAKWNSIEELARKTVAERDELRAIVHEALNRRDAARYQIDQTQRRLEQIEDQNLDKKIEVRALKDAVEQQKATTHECEASMAQLSKEILKLKEEIKEQERSLDTDGTSHSDSTELVPPVCAAAAMFDRSAKGVGSFTKRKKSRMHQERQAVSTDPFDCYIDSIVVGALPTGIVSIEEQAAKEKAELRLKRQESAHRNTLLRRQNSD